MNLSKKRGGQVTVFMILSLIIILLGGLYFYYEDLFRFEPRVEPELVPIKDYIDGCIDDIAERGVFLIGQNGGFIDIPDTMNDPRGFLNFGPGNDFRIPYWWYDGIDSMPTEEFIINQLEEYVESELRACVGEFEAFRGEYIVAELGGLDVTVELGEENVIIDAHYPLDVNYNSGEATLKIEEFTRYVNVRLKKVYELAKSVMTQENRDSFIEKRTIDLMSLNRDIPITDISSSCEPLSWNLVEIKDKVKNLLTANLPFIRVRNSEYQENSFVPTPDGKNTYEDSYFQKHYLWDVTTEDISGMSVNVMYDNSFPFDIDARPRDGRLLQSRPMRGSGIIGWLCLQIYHFTYDLEFPVKVSITDSATKKHDAYVFNFPFEISIDHNEPRREQFSRRIFPSFERGDSKEYCEDLYDEIVIYTVANNSEQHDIDDVNLSFTCGRFTCSLPQSEYLSNGAAAGIIQEMPYCVYGILRGKKEGFEDSEMFIQTDRPSTYTLYMNPLKKFTNYKVVKHPLAAPSDQDGLKKTEKATIHIKEKDGGFETFGVYPAQGDVPIELRANKEYTYEVTIYLIDGDELVGGYKADWKVDPDDLIDAREIIFHVLDQGFANEEDRFLFITGLSSYSDNIPKPELV